MPPLVRLAGLLALFICPLAKATEPLRFQLFMHCEQPTTADTPNFKTMPAVQAGNAGRVDSYAHWRAALLAFARLCYDRGVAFNYQSDWNFLEGVRKWEVESATALPGITNDTGGKNILRYLHEDLGVELDPHSHEGQGYTYADVAWLLHLCGVEPSGVVGGHRWDPTGALAMDYDRMADPAGVAPAIFAGSAPNWHPSLLIGLASTDHINDPHDSGLWLPASTGAFFTHDANKSLPAIGGWQRDLHAVARLMDSLESGELTTGPTVFWTSSFTMNHRDIVDDTYLASTAPAVLDTLKNWQDAGRLRTQTFEAVLADWNAAGRPAHVYLRPTVNLSFSLNWQDFYFTAQSASYLEAILNLHEETAVPCDLFFTTWQTEVIADSFPDLMDRLRSSGLVAQNYHVRAPKPYATGFEWGELASSATSTARQLEIVTDFETHKLDLTTALPVAGVEGGYARLTALQGYAPLIVGSGAATSPVNLGTTVNGYFRDAGAQMIVQHSVPVNLGAGDGYSGLLLRPEHVDWKLIRTVGFEPIADDPQPATLNEAVTQAQAVAGGIAPWFIGVKLHDNDLFATQSAWTLVWPNANSASWSLARLSQGNLLSDATQVSRYGFYDALVREAATRRAEFSLNNAFDLLGLSASPQVRPLSLSHTRVVEGSAGLEVARISGGGVISGQSVRYSLVAGAGDTDNAVFSISGDQLLAASSLNYETAPHLHLRLRWEWVDALDGSTVRASGERELAVAVADNTADDDDGDGQTQAQEAVAGTDPSNGMSSFRITGQTYDSASGATTLTFASVVGRNYTLQRSLDLATWTEVSVNGVLIRAGTGSPITLTDVYTPIPGKIFYRVAVTLAQ